MDRDAQDEREIRAARNQALFRSVNEKMVAINETFGAVTQTFTIACECADTGCIQLVDITADEYATIRANPRQFAVLTGHVYPDVEKVVDEFDRYVVVEKQRLAAEVAERTQPEPVGE